MKKEKKRCPGSEDDPVSVTKRSNTEYRVSQGANPETIVGKCMFCDRWLAVKTDGTLRLHFIQK